MTKMTRPESTNAKVSDGLHKGETISAEIEEKDSKFSDTGRRDFLVLKIRILEGEEEIYLYHSVAATWSPKGKMVKLLDDLGMLPEPGEELDLDDFENLPVQVLVENVEKDDVIYSNVIRLKRSNKQQKSIIGTDLRSRRAKAAPIVDELGLDSDDESEE